MILKQMVTQMTSHIFIFNVNKQILDLLSNTTNNNCDLYFFCCCRKLHSTEDKKHDRNIAHITHIDAKTMQH